MEVSGQLHIHAALIAGKLHEDRIWNYLMDRYNRFQIYLIILLNDTIYDFYTAW
jgi:hypothetical protein